MVVVNKGPKWYEADDVKKPVPSRKHIHKPTKLRSSIKPGAILILLAGKHRGSRVVFLKQLSSGMLLVTGPFVFNGVPLKRVHQAFVIGTNTTIDISGIDISQFDDSYFRDKKKAKKEKKEKKVMETDDSEGKAEKEKKGPSDEKIKQQKSVDDVLVKAIEKEPLMSNYMKTKFALKKGQYPHEMHF